MNSTNHPLSVNCGWTALEPSITFIEDPISATPIDINLYKEVYGQILEGLDGSHQDTQVSVFFELSNETTLVFRNDQARHRFQQEAEELNLIPKVGENN